MNLKPEFMEMFNGIVRAVTETIFKLLHYNA